MSASGERDARSLDGAARSGDDLERLVAEALRCLSEGGSEADVRAICGGRSDLLPDVLESVRVASGLAEVQARSVPTDPFLRTILSARYRIDERLGSGAMGVVYSGTDLDLGRRVAVKVVHASLMGAEQSRIRFDREAAALAAISHESVVRIYDRGMTPEGAPFLVMELVEGVSFSQVLGRAGEYLVSDSTAWLRVECGLEVVPESSLFRQMIRWGASVASGLEAAHTVGVYHRDVKPSNLMVRRDGRIVLLDFGIASREGDETLTRSDAAIGTPAYMAPEILLGKRRVVRAAQDVYGLAATIYHMLTLRAPYKGTPTEIMAKLATREPEPAVSVRPGLPRDAQAILDCGLARSPERRYPSPAAMEKDLRALLSFQPVSVRPTTAVSRALSRLRRSKLMIGAGLASLMIGSLLLLQAYQSSDARRREAVFLATYPRVPANLGIVSPVNRFIHDESIRAGVREVLDRLVETGRHRPVSRTLRAAFRLDHGDCAGAVLDMREAALAVGTPYASALLDSYRQLPGDASSALELDLDGLPEPVEPYDHYLAAVHSMRMGRYREAVPHLGVDGLEDEWHACDLALLLRTLEFGPPRNAGRQDALDAVAEGVLEDASRVERRFGSPSAGSAHVRSAALLEQRRFDLVLLACSQGLALTPASHVTLQNAAKASRALGRTNEALSFLDRALAIVPGYLPLRKLRWEARARAGEFAAAFADLDASDFGNGPDAVHQEQLARAQVHLEESIALRLIDLPGSMEAASDAMALIEKLPDRFLTKEQLATFARHLRDGDPDEFFVGLVARLETEPLSEIWLAYAVKSWPKSMDSEGERRLRSWMESLQETLSRTKALGAVRGNHHE